MRRTLLLAAGASAAALYLALCWRPLFLQASVPVDGNVIAVTYPDWALARSLWKQPRWPLWNPWRDMGVPHAADPITSALYPPLLALSTVPDFAGFLRLWVALHTALAAGFAGLLLWRRGRGLPAALASALLAGCNGFFTARVVFPHHFASAAWLPAALYFQDNLSPLGLGAALALQWLAGYPTFSCLTAVILLALAAAQGRSGLICFARGSIWALGLAAIQWLPFLEFLAHSSRGLFLHPEMAIRYSLSFGQLIKELLLPQWYALRPSLNGDPAILAFYVGLPALVLAAWGAWRGGRRERTLAAVAAAAAVLSLGASLPGYAWAKPLHLFRYPANWLLLTSAASALLCGEGIARLPSVGGKAAATAAIAADLLLFAQFPRVAWASPEFLESPPALAILALKQPQPCRVYHAEPMMRLWENGTLATREDYFLMRDFLAPSYGMAFGLQEMTDFQTMRLSSSERYRLRLDAEGPRSPLLDWAGACVVVTVDADARRVERAHVRTLVRGQAKPRVFCPEDPGADIRLEAYAPGSARARARLARAGTVVFAESEYPGWRAWVDGRAAPLALFKDEFLAVRADAGEHEVLFRFMAPSFWIGFAVSLVTAAFLATAFLSRKMR